MQGRSLTVQERTIMQPYFAHIVLERARIVDGFVGGRVPFWLTVICVPLCWVTLFTFVLAITSPIRQTPYLYWLTS